MLRFDAPLVLIALGCALTAGCSEAESVTADPVDRAGEVPAVSPQVLEVELGPELQAPLRLDSRITSEAEVWLVARTTGQLVEVHVDRGDAVEKGQVLAQFDHEEEQLFFRAAEAELAHAVSVVTAREKLWCKGYYPDELLDEARLDLEIKQARLELAGYRLARTRLIAPFAGVILDRKARPGMQLQEADGTPLFLLSREGPLEARAYLPEWALAYLRLESPVLVSPVFGDPPLEARVRWLSPVVDPVAGTVEVRVRLTKQATIRLGSAVILEFPLISNARHPAIPRASLLGGEPRPGETGQILRLVAGGEWEPVTVRIGLVGAERVEVREGLTAGDRILASARDAALTGRN